MQTADRAGERRNPLRASTAVCFQAGRRRAGEADRALFEAPRPTTEAVAAGQVALAGGDQAVYVVRQVRDADPAALGDAEREAVRQQIAARRAQREFDIFVSQQRADADVNIQLGTGD